MFVPAWRNHSCRDDYLPRVLRDGLAGLRSHAPDAAQRYFSGALLSRGPRFRPSSVQRGSRLCAATQERCSASGTEKEAYSITRPNLFDFGKPFGGRRPASARVPCHSPSTSVIARASFGMSTLRTCLPFLVVPTQSSSLTTKPWPSWLATRNLRPPLLTNSVTGAASCSRSMNRRIGRASCRE